MRRKRVIYVVVLTLLAGIVAAGIQTSQVLGFSNREISSKAIRSIPIDLPQKSNDIQAASTSEQTLDTGSNGEIKSEMGIQTEEEDLALMTNLMEIYYQQNFKPGWLHLSNEYVRSADKGAGTLPNNVDIPD